jgi:hypothetical protein
VSNSDKTIDDDNDDSPLAALDSEISNNHQMGGEEVETTIAQEEEHRRPSQNTVHLVPDGPTHTHNLFGTLRPTSHDTTSFFTETSDERKNQQEVSSSILSRIHVAKDMLKETKTSLKRLREKSIQVFFFCVTCTPAIYELFLLYILMTSVFIVCVILFYLSCFLHVSNFQHE